MKSDTSVYFLCFHYWDLSDDIWRRKRTAIIYFRYFLILHAAFFSISTVLTIHVQFWVGCLSKREWYMPLTPMLNTELVQISQTDVSPFKRQFSSPPDHVASYKNQNEKILEPNKRSLLLLWLVVRSELRLEFLKKSAEPLTKLRLDKLKTRKI